MVSIVLKSNRFYEITSTEYTTPLLKKIQQQLGEHFNLLVEPFELDLIEKEILDWYKTFSDCDGVYEDNLLYSHIFKYPWLCWGMTSYHEINYYLKNRWDMTIKEFKETKSKLDKKQNERVLRNALKSTLINSSFIQLKETIELVHQISLSRMKIKNAWAGIFLFMLPLINEVANRKNLPPQIVHQYYLSDEIITLLTEYKQVAAETITERKDNVLWYHNKFYQGQQAVAIFNTLNVYSDSKIKGEMVYPGNIKGKVYLWDSYNIENLEKLKIELEQAKNEKFIFICSMAQPSISQYFSSFHAIITEEGGILSHAAIIAREQKIPCIVGVDRIMEKVKHLQEITLFSDGSVVLS
jgi:phosphohistidine swiveling domain-containing protein